MHLSQVARVTVLLLTAVPVLAATLSVSIDGSRTQSGKRDFTIKVEDTDGRVVERVIAVSRPVQLDLQPGSYRLSLVEPAHWAAPREVYVPASGASTELTIYPEGAVRGRITGTRLRDRLPDRLLLRFQSADGLEGPRGETPCAIVRQSFSCRVPAVRLDLALKAQGYITRYRWGIDASSPAANTGEIDLVPGAVLTGYVMAPRGVPLEKAAVRAAPRRSAPAAGDGREERSGLASHSASVSARGFFHFDGIAPGEYTVEATAGSRKSVQHTVRVIESAEAELREPLVLEDPHDVQVSVRPARDPYNRRWIVKLERRTSVDMIVETERQEALADDGHGTLHSVPAGHYTLVLSSEGGETWAQRPVTIPEASFLEIVLPKTFIRGTLTLHGQPLQANVELHQDAGAAVAARSGRTGKFALFFPESGVERIDRIRIRSDAPRIDRVLTGVRVTRNGEKATLDIDLPATYLAGVVVDARGKSVAEAVVRVEAPGERAMHEVPVNDDGSFEMHALPAGRLRLRAYGVKATSNAVDVDVAENGPTANIRLVVQPSLRLTGRVLSPGGPVPGAFVYAFPQPGGAVATPIHTTDPDGRFDIAVPAEATKVDVFVSAPSFATQFFRHDLSAAGEMNLPLSQTSGALLVETGDADPPSALHHRGAEIGLPLFAYHGATRDAGGLRIPNLEPGAYAVCSRGGKCVTATVLPQAEARVRVD